ncbi:hypothetical protein FO519_002614 [Halicephalobus sp. NKZ332]|nr:hypothetical protein FO519_002614 [Halicephalobus sp. NKZ332]
MSPVLIIQDVHIDIYGRLRRGCVKFTPDGIYCFEKATGQKRTLRVKYLMRIENIFLGTKQGLRMTTRHGELLRFGQLNKIQLEEARIFMAVNWKKRLLKLDSLTKNWILKDSKDSPPPEPKKEVPDGSLKLKKQVLWPLHVKPSYKLPLFNPKYSNFQLHRRSTKAKKLHL